MIQEIASMGEVKMKSQRNYVIKMSNPICICMAKSLCCIPETSTTLLVGYTPVKNKKVKKKKPKKLTREKKNQSVNSEGEIRIFSSGVSSVAQSCPTLCNPMNRSMPGLPVHHQLPEFTQTHVHQVGDAIQPSHPLSSPSPPDPNPSQH